MTTPRKIVDLLFDRVPEFAPIYEAKKEVSGRELGAHVVFGDVLNPYLIAQLESGAEPELIARIFDLLESLASDSNPGVRDVVRVTVCERLGAREEWLGAARRTWGRRPFAFPMRSSSNGAKNET